MAKWRTPFWALVTGMGLTMTGSRTFAQEAPSKTAEPTKPQAEKEKPAPVKSDKTNIPSLDDMVARALKNNPDLHVAELKLHEAEAELNRLRLQVTQKVVGLSQALKTQESLIESAQASLKIAEATLDLRMRQHRAQRLSQDELGTAQAEVERAKINLIAAKAKRAELNAEAQYLVGQPSSSQVRQQAAWALSGLGAKESLEGSYREYLTALVQSKGPALATPMADKIRKALDKPVSLNYQLEPLPKVLEDLGKSTSLHFQFAQIPFPRIVNPRTKTVDIVPLTAAVNLKMDTVSLGTALQALEDTIPKLRFVPRDYGILVTMESEAPPDAIRLHNFWKAKPSQKPKPENPGDEQGKNPATGAKGAIQEVDPKTGLVAVSIGSAAGLEVGNTLDVYRVKPKPTFVGTVRIVEVKATQAVARPKTPLLAGPIRVGDEVAAQVKP